MGEDVRGQMIWYVREDFFSYLLGDIDVLKWEVFCFVWVKYQKIVHNIPTSRIFFKEPGGQLPTPRPSLAPPLPLPLTIINRYKKSHTFIVLLKK